MSSSIGQFDDRFESRFSQAKVLRRGEKVFIRTVTTYYVGVIVDMNERCISLRHASWVADTGRFSAAIAAGSLKETEPYPGGVIVMRQSIVDCCIWEHALPATTDTWGADGAKGIFDLYSVVARRASVFIRTVTCYYVGEISDADLDDSQGREMGSIALVNASWVADTGRFGSCLSSGVFKEVEPYTRGVVVMLQAVVDICGWPHALPTEAK